MAFFLCRGRGEFLLLLLIILRLIISGNIIYFRIHQIIS
ncbi:putative membrane protein [Serratia marcescens]|nr:putative membrane protein [Serratia marcescens]